MTKIPINKVTFICQTCKTSIALNIPTDKTEMSKLINDASNVKCPMCSENLSFAMRDTLKAISDYCNADSLLSRALNEHHAIIE